MKLYWWGCPEGVVTRKLYTWQAVSLLGHGNVAHALVVWVGPEITPVCDVVEVLDPILFGHFPAHIRNHQLYDMHTVADLASGMADGKTESSLRP